MSTTNRYETLYHDLEDIGLNGDFVFGEFVFDADRGGGTWRIMGVSGNDVLLQDFSKRDLGRTQISRDTIVAYWLNENNTYGDTNPWHPLAMPQWRLNMKRLFSLHPLYTPTPASPWDTALALLADIRNNVQALAF